MDDVRVDPITVVDVASLFAFNRENALAFLLRGVPAGERRPELEARSTNLAKRQTRRQVGDEAWRRYVASLDRRPGEKRHTMRVGHPLWNFGLEDVDEDSPLVDVVIPSRRQRRSARQSA